MKRLLSVFFFLTLFTCSSYGKINYFDLKANDGVKAKITLDDLQALPSHSFSTATIYTPKSTFLGVKFSDFAKKYNLTGKTVRAFAWDDYSYSMPVDELLKYNVIIAYKRNGDYMSIDKLGPFAIVYPRDSHPELDQLDINAKTVWQLKRLEVK
jgi:hypothetical protein